MAGSNTRLIVRTHRRKDGSVFPADIAGRVFDLQGRLVRLAAVRDMSERARTELALRESEERFRSLLETTRDVLYRVDLRTGRDDYISRSAQTMVGFSVDELMAMDAEASLSLVHPDDVPALRRAMKATLETGEGEGGVPPADQSRRLPLAVESHDGGHRRGRRCPVP